ncbi:hypothetical protein QYE76_009140 [Lolium multiflorum]|uniref:Response regulatory domain-containing protein n=1 Tax=Lolium multiflorum TaxID=4521 RepID=A0AAD8TUP7_LOLMU|nr:hypothetical protein QYE76_009140 [Lolium multiflorum]
MVVAEDNFPDGLRVLAVDDDRVCLRVLAAVLRQCNYKPTVVTDGMTALKMLREEGEEQFDLVITDVHMPNMDGFQLLEIIGLEMDLPTHMLNGGEGASGILHVQDEPAGQQASNDQPTYNTSNFLDDIFASMASQDFNPDATLLGEEY